MSDIRHMSESVSTIGTMLLERVETTIGANRRLDAALWSSLDDEFTFDCDVAVKAEIVKRMEAGGDDGECPRYTGSIDAALALVERLRPGWNWKTETGSVSGCPRHPRQRQRWRF